MKKYFSGLKFGLMLQLAVGPMCLMVFNYSQNSGFWVAFSLVLAIALVDAFYILLAGFGVSKLLSGSKVKNVIKIVGSIILFIFGLNIILGVFGINIIPSLNLSPNSSSAFVQGIILTLSNPMTIILWSGVLTTRLIEENFSKKQLVCYSLGLVSSTLIFLTMVAFLGMILSSFIPPIVSSILNILVGLLIIGFGIKLLLKK
ncbi:MAG: LysE family transporter [Clostridia bacterium]|nr:LysE family transporter [Clostridia bacterium]